MINLAVRSYDLIGDSPEHFSTFYSLSLSTFTRNAEAVKSEIFIILVIDEEHERTAQYSISKMTNCI